MTLLHSHTSWKVQYHTPCATFPLLLCLQGAARVGGLLRQAADVTLLHSHTSHMLAELSSALSKIRSLQDRVHTLRH